MRRRVQSKSRDRSIGAADIDTDAQPKRPRGRPRKSIQPAVEDEDTIVVEVPKTTMAPIETSTSASMDKQTPTLDVASNRSRTRRGTPHSQKVAPVTISSDEASEDDSDVLTPISGEEEEGEAKGATTLGLSTSRTARQDSSMPSQSPSAKLTTEPQVRSGIERHNNDDYALPFDDADDDDDDDDAPDVTNFAFEEGTTRMPDDMTVLDSEDFSMISVDSLPSYGGLSSPPKPAEPQNTVSKSIASVLQRGNLKPPTTNNIPSESKVVANSSSSSMSSVPASIPVESSNSAVAPRYKTPVVDTETPSAPPAIEPVQVSAPKIETPKMGRVVTAGVALQGLLDPSRLTPESSQTAQNEKQRDRLDDLFRGFSTGTRKDLQAGLRLGEQLAQSKTKEQSSPVPAKTVKAAPKESVFRTQRKQRSRLLTPEEQDELVTTVTPPSVEEASVQYPTLTAMNNNSQIPSPSESENEMNWEVDNPPIGKMSAEGGRLMTVTNEHGETLRGLEIAVVAEPDDDKKQDNYDDIWQEEASRSSNSDNAEEPSAEDPLQQQDLFAEEGRVGSARGNPSRTWRRRNKNYSAKDSKQPTPPRTKSPATLEKGKVERVEAAVSGDGQFDGDKSATSDASDDTGMFFQSNTPAMLNKRWSSNNNQKKADKLDLSLLLNEGESLLPESSPPVVERKPSSTRKPNPFLDTPPRFPAYPTSPKKSSPLRQELRSSDISSDISRHSHDESTLPLGQSSPFRVHVDGDSMLSMTSDQRQIHDEIEGVTASSIRRVRNEADGYLEAYEPQERSLGEIEEVTEVSRTGHEDVSMMPSSPPQIKQGSTQRPHYASGTAQRAVQSTSSETAQSKEQLDSDMTDVTDEEVAGANSTRYTPPTSEASQEETQPVPKVPTSRMTATPFSAPSHSEPPPSHPILTKFTALPKIEPWTKTHYKTLDKLYSTHLKHPALFSPSTTRTTPLSQTNSHLLASFLATNKHPYVGATFSAWGYSMLMTEELVVLCAVFMQLLSLENTSEYERVAGKRIQFGDCAPGRSGAPITGEEVVRRLATVVMGESLRRDEKAGKKADKREGLSVVWPH